MTTKLAYIEAALDAGEIRALAPNGNYGSCRRNGKTVTWVRLPNEFRIPVKIGFRGYGYISHLSTFGFPGDGPKAEFQINQIAGARRDLVCAAAIPASGASLAQHG